MITDISSIWKREQENLSRKCQIYDSESWQLNLQSDCLFKNTDSHEIDFADIIEGLNYVVGLDISYIKGSNDEACVAVVILDFPKLNVIYENISMIQLENEYIPGFLSYREAPGLIKKLEEVIQIKPTLKPQVIFVDGNGILHPRKFGLACQIGLYFDIPCVGVAKNLYFVDGLQNDTMHNDKIMKLKKSGDYFALIGSSGVHYGYALRSTKEALNPIYISPGHKISIESSLHIVRRCCKFRIPEPIRQADMRSREFLRQKGFVKNEVSNKKKTKKVLSSKIKKNSEHIHMHRDKSLNTPRQKSNQNGEDLELNLNNLFD